MRAILDNLAVCQHHDAVERRHGGQAMCHHNGGAATHQVLERLLHQRLGLAVQGRRRLVEHQDRRVGQDSAGNGHALALAARNADAALAHHGVKATGQAIDKLGRVGQARCLANLLVSGVGAAVGDILANGAVEQQRLLRHVGNLAAQALLRAARDVLAVHEHATALYVVQAQQQLGECRLAEPDLPTRPTRWPPPSWSVRSLNTLSPAAASRYAKLKCSKSIAPSPTLSSGAFSSSATRRGSSSTRVISAASPSARLMRCIMELT